MEPPSKRPRLYIFGDLSSSNAELDTARMRNDLALKSRFESIFEKYSQDFTNVGDEIDIFTGDVIVDNGHLQRMDNETDTGRGSSRKGGSTYDGRSLLMAMAAAPHDELVNPDADEVMQSIENIADNAFLQDNGSGLESEDDLFDVTSRDSESQKEIDDTKNTSDKVYSSDRMEDSDIDSLFEQRCLARSESIDSLFEQDVPKPQSNRNPDQSILQPYEEEVLAKYRPMIEREVLEERNTLTESRLEPAWRIPIHIEPMFEPIYNTRRMESDQSFEDQNTLSRSVSDAPITSPPNKRRSLWKQPRKSRKVQSSSDWTPEERRDESEDPLQLDFSSEEMLERRTTPSSDFETSFEYTNRADDDELYAEHEEQKRLLEIAATGVCPYCKVNYYNKSGVMAHWDRWVVKPSRHKPSSDPHDNEMMRDIRSTVTRRIRQPRLVLSDFQTIVELYEGAGLSFEEIAESKTLRTRKTAYQLRDIFDKHRTIPLPGHSPAPSCRWTSEEEQILTEVCENNRVTMATITRKLPGKDEIDVGNKLAERFLSELGTPGRGAILNRHLNSNNLDNGDIQVKVESDDDLFA